MGYLLFQMEINSKFEIFFIGMRQFNRVLGFVAVSFVLLFLGRVSKTSLYTVYFKTIAEVEIRNSQALDLGDAHFDIAAAPNRNDLTSADPTGFSGILSQFEGHFQSHFTEQTTPSKPSVKVSVGLRCFMEVAPRAPGA